jgi:hemerythrin superfamily protein
MPETAQTDAVRFLKDQHQQVRDLLDAVAQGSGEARREAFEPLVRLLAVHETAEEIVVYPAARSAGEEGTRVAEARLKEEDEAKKMLSDLERLDLSSPEFEEKFAAVRAAVEAHADAEERELFPLLEDTVDDEQRRRMGVALQVAEGIAPTHPHKSAPESAVGNLLVGPFVGMVDRVRDLLRDAGR